MSKTLRSPRHEALRALIRKHRKDAGLTQAQVAERLDRYQSYVAMMEAGERRIEVIEFIEIAEAIGFDPSSAIKRLQRLKPE